MRVTFDTNIYISAFAIPGGSAEEAYRYAVHRHFELFASIAILTETANTLSNKFAWSNEKIESLLTNIGNVAVVLKTQPHIHVLHDEPDNRILECGVQAQADIIVTGDQHLLALKHYEGIILMKLSEFLAMIRTRVERNN